MINPRETIYAAVYTKLVALKTAGTVNTVSRRWRGFSDVPQEAQPAIYQMQVGENKIAKTGLPDVLQMNLDLYVYVAQQDDTAPYSTTLNPILDAIDAIFKPDDSMANECTLGGLVARCRPKGAIEIYEGVNEGRQIVAVIPIEILAV